MQNSARFLALVLACWLDVPASAEIVAFSQQIPPPAPDYALASSWAASAAKPGASAAIPEGATPAAGNPRIDVFFIHPTTFKTDSRWNADVADPKVNDWTDASSIARQASVFNGCCRVFAPRYRQAAFLDKDDGRDRAQNLAYGDIERAFDHYLNHDNKGRPFILAGHSQGGLMVARLLEKRIAGTPLAGRLVAAYIVGMNVAEGEFTRQLKLIPICNTPAQTGCAVQWNAILPSADLAAASQRSEKLYTDKFGDDAGKVTLCINPLTFDRKKPIATAERSRGAVPGDPGAGPLRPLVAGAVAATCDRGFLVTDPSPALELKPLPGGSLHYHDFGLFFADIRANAILRSQAYLASHGGTPINEGPN